MPAIITADQFRQIFPKHKDPDGWAEALDYVLFEFGIIDAPDVAMFLAQCGHESGEFTIFLENLNYSADALLRVFPKYFKDRATAEQYHRKPEMIANRVYSNRMENGPESSGEGWKYRGRGVLQITGKRNYRLCSKYLYDDENVLLDDPDILLEKRDSLLAACWFWETNKLKGIHDIVRATRIVNGGRNGLAHRTELHNKALSVLN